MYVCLFYFPHTYLPLPTATNSLLPHITLFFILEWFCTHFRFKNGSATATHQAFHSFSILPFIFDNLSTLLCHSLMVLATHFELCPSASSGHWQNLGIISRQTCQLSLIQSEFQAIAPPKIGLKSEKWVRFCPIFQRVYICYHWVKIAPVGTKIAPISDLTQLPHLRLAGQSAGLVT